MASASRIASTETDGILIVRFLDRQLFDEPVVREVSEEVLALLPEPGEPVHLILDFNGVELVSSSMLGKLIQLHRKIAGSGGKLLLCELSNNVRAAFRSTNLERLFTIVRDRREAIEVF